MPRPFRFGPMGVAAVAVAAVVLSGCTGVREYFHNGLKVGPNYSPPGARVAEHWIDAADKRLSEQSADLSQWWAVFNDPVLNRLIACAYEQNLSLREAGFRILEARALKGIAVGSILPQVQSADGSYRRIGQTGPVSPQKFFDQWGVNFNLAWELDFWGRFRRAITAADDRLEASCLDYDQVLVTLLGDVAFNYVTVRTLQRRIDLLKEQTKLQEGIVQFIETRLRAGFKVTELDLDQAHSDLARYKSAVPNLQEDVRVATNRLCVLMGMPPTDLEEWLGTGKIPTAPPEVAVGIPANLLRQRPDVRRAERLAAAQSEQIGIAQTDLYPIFTINGTMGWQARHFSKLFTPEAFNGSVGPSFRWDLLNYGRILNGVRYEKAAFQELITSYQQTVLLAAEEVEEGLVTFLRAQEQAALLEESVQAAHKAVKIVVLQYEKGAVDFNRYAVIQRDLVERQDLWAQSQGKVPQALIRIYRALGGGWEIRGTPPEMLAATPVMSAPPAPMAPEEVPAPGGHAIELPKLPAAPLPRAPEVPNALPAPPLAPDKP